MCWRSDKSAPGITIIYKPFPTTLITPALIESNTMMEEPIRPTTCQHCGAAYNTSAVHPSPYCSIACEEGRGPLPHDSPESPAFPDYVQGNPESLIGRNLIAVGLRRTCYSPDWHRKPKDYNNRCIVDHDEENEILVVKDDIFLGKVTGFELGHFTLDTREYNRVFVDASLVVSQLRNENWWAE